MSIVHQPQNSSASFLGIYYGLVPVETGQRHSLMLCHYFAFRFAKLGGTI